MNFSPRPDWATMPFPGEGKEPSFPWRYLFRPSTGEMFPDVCKHHECNNPTARPNSDECHKCRNRRHRISNPWSYYFNLLKLSAKKRNISFDLTKEEFREFCDRTNYLKCVGKNPGSFHIDRVDNFKGYEAGNIQLMECSANVGKGNKERHQTNPNTSELFDE